MFSFRDFILTILSPAGCVRTTLAVACLVIAGCTTPTGQYIPIDPNSAQGHYLAASFIAGDPSMRSEAIEHLRSAVSLRPDFAGAWEMLGDLLALEPDGRMEATVAFKMATIHAPGNVGALLKYARLRSEAAGGLPDAIEACRAILALDPNHVDAMNNLALFLANTPGGRREALVLLEQAVALDPLHAKALANLAFFYASDNPDTARNLVERSLRADSNDAYAYFVRGKLNQAAGNKDGAIADFGRAIELDPGNVEAWHSLAATQYDLERWEESLAAYKQALEIQPARTLCIKFAAYNLWKLGRLDEALEWTTRYLDASPLDAFGWNLRGLINEEKALNVEAISDYSRAIELNPQVYDLHVNRALTRSKVQDWEGALVDNDAALAINPDGDTALRQRGRARFELGDRTGALADFDRAVKVNPGEFENWYQRGDVRHRAKDYQGSITDLTEALRLIPDDDWTLGRRAESRIMTGDVAGAMADADRSVAIAPASPVNWNRRAILKLAAGDYRGSLADFEKVIAQVKSESVAISFLCHLLQRRLGEQVDAGALRRIAASDPDPWARTVAHFLLGIIDEQRLLADATNDPERLKERLCEAYYYAGMVRSIEGREGARALFEQCIAQGVIEFFEHEMAQLELNRLDGVFGPAAMN